MSDALNYLIKAQAVRPLLQSGSGTLCTSYQTQFTGTCH
jgi:hypothetical protein